MTAIGLALDRRLRSGTCTAVSKHSGRSPSRSATAEPPRGGLKDYCLLDELGECLGTIAATRIRPVLGNNAPTLYLRRERDVGAPHTQIHGGDEAEHRARLQRAVGEVYRLGELIGRGGVGAVYEAYDVQLLRDVAVGALRHDLFPTTAILERLGGGKRGSERAKAP